LIVSCLLSIADAFQYLALAKILVQNAYLGYYRLDVTQPIGFGLGQLLPPPDGVYDVPARVTVSAATIPTGLAAACVYPPILLTHPESIPIAYHGYHSLLARRRHHYVLRCVFDILGPYITDPVALAALVTLTVQLGWPYGVQYVPVYVYDSGECSVLGRSAHRTLTLSPPPALLPVDSNDPIVLMALDNLSMFPSL
jgi:hypothetical protein